MVNKPEINNVITKISNKFSLQNVFWYYGLLFLFQKQPMPVLIIPQNQDIEKITRAATQLFWQQCNMRTSDQQYLPLISLSICNFPHQFHFFMHCCEENHMTRRPVSFSSLVFYHRCKEITRGDVSIHSQQRDEIMNYIVRCSIILKIN